MHQNELIKTRNIVDVKWLRGNNWAVVLHHCRRRNFNRSLWAPWAKYLANLGFMRVLSADFATSRYFLPISAFAISYICYSFNRAALSFLLLIALFISVWEWFERMTAINWRKKVLWRLWKRSETRLCPRKLYHWKMLLISIEKFILDVAQLWFMQIIMHTQLIKR